MNKEELINDLKDMLDDGADRVSEFGTEFWSFSRAEVEKIINVLENNY